MGKDKQTDFESSLKALESIVKRLEDENINLEDSVKEVISNFKSLYFFGDGNFFGFLLVP